MATPFGELLGKSDAEMNAELQDYVDMGVDWIRLDIHWSLVQPSSRGGFDWTLVDKVFNAVEARGIKITAVLNNTPDWVGSTFSNKADQEAFGRFAAAAASRYDKHVDHWEILNEQNKHGISPQNYTEVLKLAYNAIKAVDGDDTVITGGTAAIPSTGGGYWGAADYLKQMYDAGAGGYFDAVGYHPYSFPLYPSDDKPWNGWQIMEDGIRKTMVDHGDADKQIWMTEFGAKTLGGGVTVSQHDAAEMLRDAVDLAGKTSWAGPIMWFSYQDSSFEPGFGLLDGNGNRREAYYTFRDLANKDNGPGPDIDTGKDDLAGKTIQGTRGNDVLQGTSGDDVLRGGGGEDTFIGGAGKDTFVFQDASRWNAIKDWADGDVIDLRAIDADLGRGGDQAFRFIGSGWLSRARDLGVYIDQANNKTYVQGDIDGDGKHDINIVLNGVHHLDASDFLL